ncbi:MAG TPA: glycerol-3-phosphate 1-O-acyltransferase [Bacteroidetes bacterium]|nr:glycerol-3-phosphate 1-O-acyltransferase [Bacteroidota bacterium]
MAILLLVIVPGYLVGSFPTAVLVARLNGVDIFREGSGNPGASNVYRLLGLRWAFLVLAIDLMKGFIPVALAARWLAMHGGPHPFSHTVILATLGFATFFGHVKSIFLHFQGGKGVATLFGALFAIAPQAMSLVVLVYLTALLGTRTFSLASLCAAAAFPICLLVREGRYDWPTFGWSMLVPTLLLWTHRSNLKRLLRHEELPMRHDEGV